MTRTYDCQEDDVIYIFVMGKIWLLITLTCVVNARQVKSVLFMLTKIRYLSQMAPKSYLAKTSDKEKITLTGERREATRGGIPLPERQISIFVYS